MKINNIIIHITDFMQTQMSLLRLPDDVHSLCRNQTQPLSQLQAGQDEKVGPIRSNNKPSKCKTLTVF